MVKKDLTTKLFGFLMLKTMPGMKQSILVVCGGHH